MSYATEIVCHIRQLAACITELILGCTALSLTFWPCHRMSPMLNLTEVGHFGAKFGEEVV